MRRIAALLLLSFAGIAFSQCPAPALGWAATWQQAAFVAIILGYLVVSILFMVGTGFNMPKLVAAAKRDMMYLAFITMFAGAILTVDTLVNSTFLPAFETQSLLNVSPTATRQGVHFCNGLTGTTGDWNNLQQHTVDYAVCLREKNTAYFKALTEMNFVLGFVSSINLVIYPLDLLGLGFNPGVALKPVMDTMGYALYMLAMTIAQLKVQEVLLCFSKNYMFTLILPFGIALSAFSLTRSAGGALIALAIGFYLVLPITYLVSEEIVQDYCARHGDCKFGSLSLITGFMGEARDLAQDMFSSNGQKASELATVVSLDGPFGPMIYITAIASTFLPLCSLIVTLMFIKSFAQFFGADVDFSALIKLL